MQGTTTCWAWSGVVGWNDWLPPSPQWTSGAIFCLWLRSGAALAVRTEGEPTHD